jgi:alpha-mannosidase
LKASFPFSVSNKLATYDLAIGTIKRNNNTEKLYEVPGQQWADITHKDGSYGVSILNDGKYGWDKPADSILRLTLLHCPMSELNNYQTYQDIGKHHFAYSFFGHENAWNQSSVWQAASLNQPLVAFQTNAHNGNLGKSFSMASVSTKQVAIKALKKAEDGNSIIVRLQELIGENTENVMVSFASAVVSAKELNACEEKIGDAVVKDGKLQFNMKSYQPRTFAVTLANAKTIVEKTQNLPLELKMNTRVTTSDNDRFNGEFDVLGNSIPEELLPEEINSEGVVFKLKNEANEIKNERKRRSGNSAVIPKGDTINLPVGDFNRIYLLAAATEDTQGTFKVDDKEVTLGIQYYTGFIGNWYFPVFDRPMKGSLTVDEIKLIKYAPAFLKQDNIAWIGTHRHNMKGTNEAYTYCYLYKYAIDLPKGAKTLVLPNNDKIRIMAITLSKDETINTKMVSPVGIKL